MYLAKHFSLIWLSIFQKYHDMQVWAPWTIYLGSISNVYGQNCLSYSWPWLTLHSKGNVQNKRRRKNLKMLVLPLHVRVLVWGGKQLTFHHFCPKLTFVSFFLSLVLNLSLMIFFVIYHIFHELEKDVLHMLLVLTLGAKFASVLFKPLFHFWLWFCLLQWNI